MRAWQGSSLLRIRRMHVVIGMMTLVAASAGVLLAAAPRFASSAASCTSLPMSATMDIDDCIQRVVKHRAASVGIGTALADLDRTARHQPDVRLRCHLAMHPVGRDYKHALGATTIEAFTGLGVELSGADCAGGFAHGFIEEVAMGVTASGQARGLAQACPNEKPMARQACEHGLGHSFTRNVDYDVDGALAICKSLGSRAAAGNCAAGVFMEYRFGLQGVDGATTSRDLRPVEDVCRTLGTDRLFARSCWAWALDGRVSGFEITTVCSSAPAWARYDCLVGASIRASTFASPACNQLDVGRWAHACTFGPKFQHVLAGNLPEPSQIKECSQMPDALDGMACAEATALAVAMQSPTEAQPFDLCNKFDRSVRAGCLRGIKAAQGPVQFL